jgi:hypothetical protein
MIEKLRLAWHNNPEQRLCQLVKNIAFQTPSGKEAVLHNNQDIFYIEDVEFEIALNRKFGRSASSV